MRLSAEKPYDLALLDFQMPEMDGLDAGTCHQERPGDPALPAWSILTSHRANC